MIVTDGFTGNVALKTLEGSIRFAAGRAAGHGAAGSRPPGSAPCCSGGGSARTGRRMDAESYGGAALLGLDGTVVIAHGATTARAHHLGLPARRRPGQRQITEKIDPAAQPPAARSAADRAHFLRRPLSHA